MKPLSRRLQEIVLLAALFVSSVAPVWAWRGGGGGFHGGGFGGGWRGGGLGWGGLGVYVGPGAYWGDPYYDGYGYGASYGSPYDPYYGQGAYVPVENPYGPDAGAPQTVQTSAPAPSAPDNSQYDLRALDDLQLELHTLLDQKLKDGSITQAQHQSEANYLQRIDSQARSEAAAHGGYLTAPREGAYSQQLLQAYYSLSHNFAAQ